LKLTNFNYISFQVFHDFLPYKVINYHFFPWLFFRYKRIVRFFVLSNISRIRSCTSYCCLINSYGLGFSRNFIVFTRLCSNSRERLCAAYISMLESPMQMRLVTS
jgi:hypothetical protein